MQVLNWNEGNAVIKRYAVLCNTIMIVVLFARLVKIKLILFYIIGGLIIVSQIVAIFSQQDFNKKYWHSAHLNKLSKWVLNNYPEWYNPEPSVFLGRNSPYALSTTDSIVIFANQDNIITKMMVKEGSIGQLEKRGIPMEQVVTLNQKLTYHNGFAYINKKDLDIIGYVQEDDSYIEFIDSGKENKIKTKIRQNIFNSSAWLGDIKKLAIEWDLPLDSVITLNVNYVYEEGQKSHNQ